MQAGYTEKSEGGFRLQGRRGKITELFDRTSNGNDERKS